MPVTISACPICKRPATTAYHPFCSDRCKLVDLSKWFDGSYAVPVAGDFGEIEEAPDNNPDH